MPDIPEPHGLTRREKLFVHEYIYDWNATRAALASGFAGTVKSAGSVGCQVLKRIRVQAYMKEVGRHIEKLSGISRLMVLQEHAKIAFSSVASFQDGWVTKKDFDQLTPEQKACIAEIDTKTKQHKTDAGMIVYIEYIKIKLYDKQRALDAISKMLGYDEPTQINVNTSGEVLHKHERDPDYLSDLTNTELNAIQKIGLKKLGLPAYVSDN